MERIFGLLPVVNRDGLMPRGVSPMEVTGADSRMVRRGFEDEELAAVEFIPCGSVKKFDGDALQRAVRRGGW